MTDHPVQLDRPQTWLREQASARIYGALADREPAETRRNVLLALAASEVQHGERWAARLRPLSPHRRC